MAVIVVIAILSILLIYLAANIRTLSSLGRELKLLDQKQTKRLVLTSAPKTNTASVAFQQPAPAPATQ